MIYKETKCRTCGKKDQSLFFLMGNPIDDKDYFCKDHLIQIQKERSEV